MFSIPLHPLLISERPPDLARAAGGGWQLRQRLCSLLQRAEAGGARLSRLPPQGRRPGRDARSRGQSASPARVQHASRGLWGVGLTGRGKEEDMGKAERGGEGGREVGERGEGLGGEVEPEERLRKAREPGQEG
eukprot:752228-Hanusia_phi.AAC.1